MSFITDRRQLDFLLYEMPGFEQLLEHPRFRAFDRSAADQILDTAQAIAEEKFLPFAAEADSNEPYFEDGKAIVPASTASALSAYAEAGFFALPFAEEIGGLQAPWVLHMAVSGMFNAANLPVTNYATLTIAAANLLNTHGSEALKEQYLPQMLAGQWYGTMCLSEPQAGSSLADIRTTATPDDQGGYKIRGTKMWISGGEQEISGNIVHMVLAKIPGGPKGTKGISLFLVPKYRLDEAGNPGARNDITLAGLNHKLGQRGTTNCLLNFGDGDDCHGYLIGEPHRGLEYMFHMMNEARIGVGTSAIMSALGGYLYSAGYARTRPQGRGLSDRNPEQPQVPIIEHTDIRRMLMAQKVAVEGAMALSLYCATIVDRLNLSEDSTEQKDLSDLLGLLTPIVKSWPSEHCLEANKWAIQILGGYGYTRDYPVERLYRDNRLNHIHEGTFGIQGLDLVRRKIGGDRGRSLSLLLQNVNETIAQAKETQELKSAADTLSGAVETLQATVKALHECPDVETQLANATLFLDGMGTVVIGWMWLRQAQVASDKLKDTGCSDTDRIFYQGKLSACQYFMRYNLPIALCHLKLCAELDTTCLDAAGDIF